MTVNDLVDWTPQIKARALEIASHYQLGGLWDPPPLVNDKLFGSICVPGLQGGINWPGASYDPETKMLYCYSKNQMGVIGATVTKEGKVVQAAVRRRKAGRPQWRHLWRRGQP
jgi:quinoprotein glucose dehydrogenase